MHFQVDLKIKKISGIACGKSLMRTVAQMHTISSSLCVFDQSLNVKSTHRKFIDTLNFPFFFLFPLLLMIEKIKTKTDRDKIENFY